MAQGIFYLLYISLFNKILDTEHIFIAKNKYDNEKLEIT